ncbi:MAG: hypothetical protein M3237_03385 [Actinomycetota bacterium]|nr:hypothetical protein [Actinomycetota bacterium]
MITTRRPLAPTAATAAALGVVLLVLVSGLVTRTPTRAQDPAALRLDLGARDLRAAMVEHDCTTTGFGDSATPRSALIRHDGRLQHVGFERAWSVFTGERPGVLLAVCLSSVAEGAVASRS